MYITTVDGASFQELKQDQSLNVTFSGFLSLFPPNLPPVANLFLNPWPWLEDSLLCCGGPLE